MQVSELAELVHSLRAPNVAPLLARLSERLDHLVEIIDMGPGAGAEGGKVVFEGAPRELLKASKSLTGKHLAARRGEPDRDIRAYDQALTIRRCHPGIETAPREIGLMRHRPRI